MEYILFYIFSVIIIISAIKVIFNRKPVESVLYLVLVFCNATGLLILLEVEYLALLFIVVYVGAIAVLFLFVVMILNITAEETIKTIETYSEYYQYIPFLFFLSLIIISGLYIIISQNFLTTQTIVFDFQIYTNWIHLLDAKQTTNIEIIGHTLYTYFVYYFLICGFILLVALLSTISLTLQVKPTLENNITYLKKQKVYQQISRNPLHAIFIIQLK